MSPPLRAGLALLWLALLVLAGWLVGERLQLSGDLRLFMPEPQTADQRLLLDSLGEGPGSRLLLLALSGADEETLAELSAGLRDRLRDEPSLRRVVNGEQDADLIEDERLPYRYLLSPTLDESALDADFLRGQLQARLQDLGSPAAALVEPWLSRDPSLEILRLVETWQPAHAPERRFGLWFSTRGEALLLAETRAPGFDPQGQQAALAAIHAALAELDPERRVRLEASGPGAFSLLMRERTQGEATRLSLAASAFLLGLLCLAYRGLRLPLLGALPLASAALAGLAAVGLLFGSVHGITLAFGITLIGVALDYPVHLFSHRQPGQGPWQTAAGLWPTLAAGAVSTVLAYAAFLLAGVPGLAQLAAFAIAGLLVAALCTRWLLPALLPETAQPVALSPRWSRAAQALARLPRWPLLLAAASAATWLMLSPRPLWNDSLAELTPVPGELLQRDAELRAELGASDVRYLLVLEADSEEALLQRCEALLAALQAERAVGRLEGFEAPCQFLPSQATQRARQARLPDAATLAAALQEARDGLPFRDAAFAPFLADVEAARQAPPLTPAALRDTALGARLAALLPAQAASPTALIGLSGSIDFAALSAFAAAQGEDLHALDLKAASESLAAGYRERLLIALLAALALLLIALAIALRSPTRVLRVLAPVLLAALLSAALLHGLGIGFTLFHLVALILASGLGLDYALFFDRASRSPAERGRTLHGIGVCAASTALVFGLLATAQIPVLRAIGLTVALGVALNFLLAANTAGRETSA